MASPVNTATLLTPPGVAAIAVVRLRGPAVHPFAVAHLSRPTRVGRCVHAELRDVDTVIDDPVAVLVDDQTLDLSLHGGVWVVESAMGLFRRFGFEITLGAPFDAADLIEQETLAALPQAVTRETLTMLLAQPAAWRAMLAAKDVAAMKRAIADTTLQTLLRTPRVALIGVANVGKSTIANRLFDREHSIVADLPGTTRDWVGETANLDGLAVMLIDTPGRRESSDPIEQQAIKQSRGVVDAADCVVLILDPTQPMPPQDALRAEADLIVMNKADLAAGDGLANLRVCGTSGEGIDTLRRLIREHLGCADFNSAVARCWTDAQRERLRSIS